MENENYIMKKYNLYGNEYYEIYYCGDICHVKEEDIKLNLGIDLVSDDDVIKYMKKYY